MGIPLFYGAIHTLFLVITGTFFNPFKSILLKNWIFTASRRVHRQTSIQAISIYHRHFSLLADTFILVLSPLWQPVILTLACPQSSFLSLEGMRGGRQGGRRRGGDINPLPLFLQSFPLTGLSIGRGKKSNFAAFLETKSLKNRLISREFRRNF